MARAGSPATALGHTPQNNRISAPFFQLIITMPLIFNPFFSLHRLVYLWFSLIVISTKAISMSYLEQTLHEQFGGFSICLSLNYSLIYLFGA